MIPAVSDIPFYHGNRPLPFTEGPTARVPSETFNTFIKPLFFWQLPHTVPTHRFVWKNGLGHTPFTWSSSHRRRNFKFYSRE